MKKTDRNPLLIVFAVTLALLLTACSGPDDTTALPPDSNVLEKIRASHYSLSDKNVDSILFECESLLFKHLVLQEELRPLLGPLQNIKFLVQWDVKNGCIIRIEGIPLTAHNDRNKTIKTFIESTTDHILRTFSQIPELFDGYLAPDDQIQQFIKEEDGSLTISQPTDRKGYHKELFFDPNLVLREIRMRRDKSLEVLTKIRMTERANQLFPQFIESSYSGTSRTIFTEVAYQDINGLTLPSRLTRRIESSHGKIKDITQITKIEIIPKNK